MTKAEEIAGTVDPEWYETILGAINNALEWAAQQCEATALGCNPECHEGCAKAIRAGKSA